VWLQSPASDAGRLRAPPRPQPKGTEPYGTKAGGLGAANGLVLAIGRISRPSGGGALWVNPQCWRCALWAVSDVALGEGLSWGRHSSLGLVLNTAGLRGAALVVADTAQAAQGGVEAGGSPPPVLSAPPPPVLSALPPPVLSAPPPPVLSAPPPPVLSAPPPPVLITLAGTVGAFSVPPLTPNPEPAAPAANSASVAPSPWYVSIDSPCECEHGLTRTACAFARAAAAQGDGATADIILGGGTSAGGGGGVGDWWLGAERILLGRPSALGKSPAWWCGASSDRGALGGGGGAGGVRVKPNPKPKPNPGGAGGVRVEPNPKPNPNPGGAGGVRGKPKPKPNPKPNPGGAGGVGSDAGAAVCVRPEGAEAGVEG